MRKIFLSIILILSTLSCKKEQINKPDKDNYILNRDLVYSALGSMNVDIICHRALPGGNDWINKNVTFNQLSSINIISNKACSITINTYTTKSGVILTPINAPAVLNLNELGSGSFDSVYYHDGFGKSQYLSANGSEYNIFIYENFSFKIKQNNGIIMSSNFNLQKISVPINNSEVISFKFHSFLNITIDSLMANTDVLNRDIGPGIIDWTASSITKSISIPIKFKTK